MGMDSNNMFDMIGTFQIFAKYWPLDPLFITEVICTNQENPTIILENNILNISNFWISKRLKLYEQTGAGFCLEKTGPKHDEDPSNKFLKILDMS